MDSKRDMIKPFVSNVDDLTDQQVLELYKALKKEGKIVKHKSSVNEEEDKGGDDAKSKKSKKKDKKDKAKQIDEKEEKKHHSKLEFHTIQPKEFELKRHKSSLTNFKDFDQENYKITEKLHDELGAFKYKVEELISYRDKLGEVLGDESIFIGEIDSSNLPDGIGIMIHKSGIIQEGYWKNGLEVTGY